MTREALVIVESSQADETLARVGQRVTLTQRLPPRLAIVRGERGDLDAVSHLPGVITVSEGAVPEPVLRRLSPTEQTFAEAWALGRQPKTARPGEGLPWDAPGFEPPDGPKK
ncbi:hypothetical protein P2318_26130 [Myxococcaceae bacterium GXIMD 01537]